MSDVVLLLDDSFRSWIPALIAAGAALAGSAYTAHENKKEAQKNRDFQEELSGNAYQRAAADLEAAGLNRINAIGSPASTPSGSTATVPDMGDAVSTGIQAASVRQQMQQSKAQENLIKEQIQTERDQQHFLRHQSEQSATQAKLNEANTGASDANTRLTTAKAIKEEKWSPVHSLVGDVVESGIDFVRSSAKEFNDRVPNGDITDRAKAAVESKMNEWRDDYNRRRNGGRK